MNQFRGRFGDRQGECRGTSATCTAVALTAVALVIPGAGMTVLAQAPEPGMRTFSEQAQVTAVDLVVEVRDEAGRVPANLGPEDFVVLEDGEAKPVVAVETFAPPSRTVSALETAGSAPRALDEELPAWTWRCC